MDAVSQAEAPRLGFGFQLADLSARDGLIALDRRFLAFLQEQDADLHARLLAARAEPELDQKAEAELVVALGPHLHAFVAALFGIEAEAEPITRATLALDPMHACKRLFVQRQAVKKYPDPSAFDGPALRAELETLLGRGADRTHLCAPCADHGRPQATRRRSISPCATPPGPR